MFDVGRVCMKTAGREAGRYCVVLKKEGSGFVLVTGPKNLTGVKRRRCNIYHLEPLVEKLKIKADASDEEVLSAFKESKLMEKLGLKLSKPIAKTKKEHKAEKPKIKKKDTKESEKQKEKKRKKPKVVEKKKKTKKETKTTKKDKEKQK